MLTFLAYFLGAFALLCVVNTVGSYLHRRCPRCRAPSGTAISHGLPVRFCVEEERCGAMWGPACKLWDLLPHTFDGLLFAYSGSYWAALWRYLTRHPSQWEGE